MSFCESTIIEGIFNNLIKIDLMDKLIPKRLNEQPAIQNITKWFNSLGLTGQCVAMQDHKMTEDQSTNFALDWHRDGPDKMRSSNLTIFIYANTEVSGGILEVENDDVPMKTSISVNLNLVQSEDDPPPQRILSFKPRQDLCVLLSEDKAHKVTSINGPGIRKTIVLHFECAEVKNFFKHVEKDEAQLKQENDLYDELAKLLAAIRKRD